MMQNSIDWRMINT